jgi:hypothetical protein
MEAYLLNYGLGPTGSQCSCNNGQNCPSDGGCCNTPQGPDFPNLGYSALRPFNRAQQRQVMIRDARTAPPRRVSYANRSYSKPVTGEGVGVL